MRTYAARLHNGRSQHCEVEVELGTVETRVRTEWHGALRAAPDSKIERGPHTVCLSDGRTGDVTITFTTTFCDRWTIAQFIGVERRNHLSEKGPEPVHLGMPPVANEGGHKP